MVDTSIFNWLIDGILSTDNFPKDAHFVATHIQHDELNRTRDLARKHRLLDRFTTLVDSTVPTESTILSISKLGSCKLGTGTLFSQLKADLDSLNFEKTNNSKDALIAEAAIMNGHTLITADKDLHIVAEKHGCLVELLDKFKST